MTHRPQPREPQAVPPSYEKSRHQEIARRYAWHDRRRRSGRRPWQMCFQRLREIETIYADRYGPELPDDDAGRDELYIAAQHIAQGGEPERNITAWASLWAPWCGKEECAALVARVISNPVRWSADTLGWRLRLTDATRTRLKVTTIGAIDCNKAARASRRKEKDAAAHKARRKASPARPKPAASSRPWEAAGISRATWYRRRNASVRQNPSTADRAVHSAADAKSLRPDDEPAKAAPAAAPRARAFVMYAEDEEPPYMQPGWRDAADAARYVGDRWSPSGSVQERRALARPALKYRYWS